MLHRAASGPRKDPGSRRQDFVKAIKPVAPRCVGGSLRGIEKGITPRIREDALPMCAGKKTAQADSADLLRQITFQKLAFFSARHINDEIRNTRLPSSDLASSP